ncbi:MAG: endolytic transglycosylase MltG [Bacteroidales bacterium]|jgi:UPF0755 protein|nr:endolytic transglycosylase MltG [Bacteroidales bacterium]
MKKKIPLRIPAIILSICIITGISAYYTARLYDSYKKNINRKETVFIPPGSSYEQLLDTLAGKLKNIRSFERVADRMELEKRFQPGRYVFEKGSNNKFIVRSIAKGWQTPLRLVIPSNIRTMPQLAGILARRMAPDSSAFMEYFGDPGNASAYGLNSDTFISLFIPNTYEVYWTSTPQALAERMKKENDSFWNGERTKKLSEAEITKTQAYILASIVCQESNYEPERPMIAGVYMNRLKTGMKLDADPTVKFAVGNFELKRILNKHLKTDSPYNTYKHAGLPPGPICIPDINSIEAVLDYKHTDYLYFCASEELNGRHKFARTIAAHNSNARAYHRALKKFLRERTLQQKGR